jgi:hypothetical protein
MSAARYNVQDRPRPRPLRPRARCSSSDARDGKPAREVEWHAEHAHEACRAAWCHLCKTRVPKPVWTFGDTFNKFRDSKIWF